MRLDGRTFLGLYVLLEPPVRNIAQGIAGGVALTAGAVWLGIGLLAWAVVDVSLKAVAGVLLLRRKT